MSIDPVTEIDASPDPRVRIFRCGETVDSFAVITDRYLVLIDTLVCRDSMQSVMDFLGPEVGRRPILVVNTHGDWDHVWGNGLFTGADPRYPAPIMAHHLATARMTGPAADGLLAAFRSGHPGRYDSSEFHPPTLTFTDNLIIHGGDLTLHLIPTPGHTPDHVAVWIPELALVFTGDAAEMPFPLVSDESDLGQLRRSLALLAELPAGVALYCHAPGMADPVLIRRNIAYFDELEERLRACLQVGRERAEMALMAEPDALGWPLEEAIPAEADPAVLGDFYRNGHNAAIRAMLRWLRTQRWSAG